MCLTGRKKIVFAMRNLRKVMRYGNLSVVTKNSTENVSKNGSGLREDAHFAERNKKKKV